MSDDDELPTEILDIAITQIDQVVENLQELSAQGALIGIEDIANSLLAVDLGDKELQREVLALMLAITLQRLAWR